LPLPAALLGEFLGRLSFIGYRIADERASTELLRFALLKRFESSKHAISSTLNRQIRFYQQLQHALANQSMLSPSLFRSLYKPSEDSVQLVLDDVALEPFAPTRDTVASVEQELRTLTELLMRLRDCEDNKLRHLAALLRERNGRKTVVFTEFRDTANSLWRSLRNRLPVGLIDGTGAWIGQCAATRQEVVERFAPVANRATVHAREAIQVLIATDVMAEGMNLQDADAVISYDLPWNPVKLIQRAGRVDRIGASHDVVKIFNFIPDREFDAFLGLARTIRSKLVNVRSVIGLERPVLEPDEQFDIAMQAVAEAHPELLAKLQVEDPEAALRSQFEPPVPIGGIACATLYSPQKHGVLVGLRRGGQSRLMLWSDRGGATSQEANDELVAALGCETIQPIDRELAARAAEACRTAAGELALLTRSDRQSVQARLAERIRSELAQIPMEDGQSVYEAGEEVLRLLGAPITASMEFDLERIATRQFDSVRALLKACRATLTAQKHTVSQQDWQITGVIVLN
jgi:hypothetical protein